MARAPGLGVALAGQCSLCPAGAAGSDLVHELFFELAASGRAAAYFFSEELRTWPRRGRRPPGASRPASFDLIVCRAADSLRPIATCWKWITRRSPGGSARRNRTCCSSPSACPASEEKWIAMHYRALGVPVVIGVGGRFDFLAGRLKRAPLWMRKCGPAKWTLSPSPGAPPPSSAVTPRISSTSCPRWPRSGGALPPTTARAHSLVPANTRPPSPPSSWLRLWVGHRLTAARA